MYFDVLLALTHGPLTSALYARSFSQRLFYALALQVADQMPRKVKKRRKAVTEDGTDAGWEEYYDYIFPDDEVAAPSLKLLALAKQWKKAAPADGEEEEEEEESEEEESGEEEEEGSDGDEDAGEAREETEKNEEESAGKKDKNEDDADTDLESSSEEEEEEGEG